jgi:uncharacterized protein YigE (DUF2233 family)
MQVGGFHAAEMITGMLVAMTRMTRAVGFALFAMACAARAAAVDCSTSQVRGHEYTTCRVDTRRETLRLFHADAQGKCFDSFERLRQHLAAGGRKLAFAMNAGMYHADCRPVGLLVIGGRELAPLNRGSAPGNFYLQPNGVLLVDSNGPRVLATDEYRGLAPTLASQSGPMLVHRGQIPAIAAFSAASRSRHLRNGVCVPREQEVAFVISEDAVTFREFAQYFLEELGCTEALYFDGSISSLYSAALKRADARASLGPMVAVVE